MAVVVDDAAVALEPHAAAAERAQADFDFADFDAGDAEVLAADVEDLGGVRGARREVVAGLVGAAEDGVVFAGDGVGERGLVHERGWEIELIDDEHLPAVRLDFVVTSDRTWWRPSRSSADASAASARARVRSSSTSTMAANLG